VVVISTSNEAQRNEAVSSDSLSLSSLSQYCRVVVQIMKIVDCHVLRSIELLAAISTVASSKNRFIFHRDGQFLAKQMVNFSSLYDDGMDTESFHHYWRDTLVNALQMGVSSSILDDFVEVAVFRPILRLHFHYNTNVLRHDGPFLISIY
jgi:hypothetical protein